MPAPEHWRAAFASSIGTSHVASGSVCQDFAALRFLISDDGDILLAAASDGAGSADCAEVGARLTVETIVAEAEAYLAAGGGLSEVTQIKIEEWIQSVTRTLSTRAEEDGRDLRDYACTLLTALVGEREAVFFQIGDGAIVVSNGVEDGWSYVFWPQHGEFANSTNFVVSPNALAEMQFELAPRRIKEIALFTDGIENLVLKRDPRSVHGPFFEKMFEPVRAAPAGGIDAALSEGLARYLSLPAICERTDDDKTLILATRMRACGEDQDEE